MSSNGHTNGTSSRVLKAGVWAPIPTFFNDNEELDVPTFQKHVVRLAQGGMQPVVCGSMGEAFHLSYDERITLFKAARSALDEAGLNDTVIIAGTGAPTTKETIKLCHGAAEAGADVTIVIAPGYYQFANNRQSHKQFFLDVAAGSPIPVMVYNFPGAAGGIDLDSTLINEIAKEGPNICGVKLTCGAVGKLTRITAFTATPSFDEFPRSSKVAPTFITLGGFADFIAPAVIGGRGHGAITGLGNIFPKSIHKLFELSDKIAKSENSSGADLKKALQLQDLVSAADAAFVVGGISGTKWYLQKHNGYPGSRVRRPMLEVSDEVSAFLEKSEAVNKLMEVEKSL